MKNPTAQEAHGNGKQPHCQTTQPLVPNKQHQNNSFRQHEFEGGQQKQPTDAVESVQVKRPDAVQDTAAHLDHIFIRRIERLTSGKGLSVLFSADDPNPANDQRDWPQSYASKLADERAPCADGSNGDTACNEERDAQAKHKDSDSVH